MDIFECLGDVEQLKLLLNLDASKVRVINRDGQTPLLEASLFGHTASVQLLLEKGADPNAADAGGKTPLQCACSEGHKACAELLLTKGASIDAGVGKPALHLAIQGWHRDVTQLLLQRGANLTQRSASTPYQGRKALHVAAESGDIEAVQLLLQHGAEVNVLDDVPLTPICYAAQAGHSHIVQLLLDRGAWLNAGPETNSSSMPSSTAAVPSGLGIFAADPFAFLQQRRTFTAATPLHLAAFGGHVSVAYLLLQRGALINCQDEEGHTPLFAAARSTEQGAGAVAALLLRNSANVDVHGGMAGYIPVLHQAAYSGNHLVVLQLLMHGADVHQRREFTNWTALHDAASQGHAEVVAVLLEHGAKVDATDDDKQTLLLWAAGGEQTHEPRGRQQCLRLAGMAAMDGQGVQDLQQQAGPKSSVRCARELLDHGADVNAVESKSGWMPLHAAAWHGKQDVAQLLLDRGADKTVTDRKGKTPRQLASSRKHTELARLLR